MAVGFSGSPDVIDMGTGAALDIANDATMSLMCWVTAHDFTTNQQFLGKGYNGGVNKTAYNFQIVGGSLFWGSYDGAFRGATWVISWTIDTWHHLYGDFDGTSGGSWHIYADGVLVASNNPGVGPISTVQKFMVGAIDVTGTPSNFLTGCMADVALLSGPLTGTEITNLAGGTLRPNTSMSKTLLGYWPLNTTGTQTDLSVNGNNGTSTGTHLCADSPPFASVFVPPTFTQSPILQTRNRVLSY